MIFKVLISIPSTVRILIEQGKIHNGIRDIKQEVRDVVVNVVPNDTEHSILLIVGFMIKKMVVSIIKIAIEDLLGQDVLMGVITMVNVQVNIYILKDVSVNPVSFHVTDYISIYVGDVFIVI